MIANCCAIHTDLPSICAQLQQHPTESSLAAQGRPQADEQPSVLGARDHLILDICLDYFSVQNPFFVGLDMTERGGQCVYVCTPLIDFVFF